MRRSAYSLNPKLVLTLLLAVVLPSFLLVLFGVRAVKNERYVLEHKIVADYEQNARALSRFLDQELETFERGLPALRAQGNARLKGHPLAAMVFTAAADGRVIQPARMPDRREISPVFFRDFSGPLIARYASEYRTAQEKRPCGTAGPAEAERENPEEYALALASFQRCRLREGDAAAAADAALRLIRDSVFAFSPLTVSPRIAGYFLLADEFRQGGDVRQYAETLVRCHAHMMSDTAALFLEECLYYASRIEREIAVLEPGALPGMLADKRQRLNFNRAIRTLEKAMAQKHAPDSGYAWRDSVLYMMMPAGAGLSAGAVLKARGLFDLVGRFEKDRPHLCLLISTAEGETLYTSFPDSAREGGLQATSGLCGRMPFFNVTLSDRKPGELHGILKFHRTLYLAFLCVLLSAIAVGVILTARAVQRELAVIRMRSNFISSVSHELKTPLTSIRMFSEMLQSGRAVDEAKRNEYYGHLRRESERLTAIINKMLDFSRVEEGRIHYEFEAQDLEKVIDDALSSLSPLLDGKDVSVNREKTKRLIVRCDRRMIVQVIVNLVDNAVKYASGPCRIDIATAVSEGSAVCVIRDWGIGIEPGEAEKIFEEFYRSKSERIREIKGTGLGLAIARKIVLDHKGKITAAPAEGGGLKVTFSLPLEGP